MGVPVSAAAYFFLALATRLQGWIFTDLPRDLGFHGEPLWWPVLPLALAGALVSLTIRYLPGTGGRWPADGFKAGEGPPSPIELPGVLLAALASLAAAGSFAAISTLLGSPILGAFLLLEASGLGGAMLEFVLVPGLLVAGIGSLIFIGLRSWTGLGTFSLATPHIPAVERPDIAEFGWALAIGLMAAALGCGIRWLALVLRPAIERRMLLATPALGLAVAGLAIAFAASTGHSSAQVLFSGQSALGPLITHDALCTCGALVLLTASKALAYSASRAASGAGPSSRPCSSGQPAAWRCRTWPDSR